MIPNYQVFMLPVLKSALNGAVSIAGIIDNIAKEMNISEEDREIRTSTGSSLLYSRIAWAKSYLVQAGLLEIVGRGLFIITSEGKKLLENRPNEINNKMLEAYPSFNAFKKRSKKRKDRIDDVYEKTDLDDLSPEEAIDRSLEDLNSTLSSELIDRILKAKPAFFEDLIMKLFMAMGYGSSWEHTGKSGDEGIDGIVNQDALGVDKIYLQAKRYSGSHAVPSGEIRNFIGSLDMRRAVKGVFVTTSYFTNDAKITATKATKNIVLIDGVKLAQLMIEYEVGCKTKKTIHIQKIDEDFFEEM